jgi:hypothetical protein
MPRNRPARFDKQLRAIATTREIAGAPAPRCRHDGMPQPAPTSGGALEI